MKVKQVSFLDCNILIRKGRKVFFFHHRDPGLVRDWVDQNFHRCSEELTCEIVSTDGFIPVGEHEEAYHRTSFGNVLSMVVSHYGSTTAIEGLRFNGGFGCSPLPEERKECRLILNQWMAQITFGRGRRLRELVVRPAHSHARSLWAGYGFIDNGETMIRS